MPNTAWSRPLRGWWLESCLGLGLILLLVLSTPALAAAGRWALVIGNDAYTKVEPLRNAVADAGLIATELKRAGFDVTTVNNADRRTLLREVIELSRRAEGGGEAAVYFAGHGVQIVNTNYLLPVDFDGSDEAMLPFEAVSLTDIGNQLLDAKTRFSLLIIDACRNNPLTGRRGRNLRSGPGLAPMSPATGQMVVYSAGSGQVALDGLGDRDTIRNGVFAREFAREMRTPGLDVRDVMLSVRESVERLAASVNHVQRPAIYDESRGRFVFYAAAAAESAKQSASPAPSSQESFRGKPPDVIEDELWAAFSGSNSRAGFTAYLREYPNGRYAGAARVQLDVLGAASAAAKDPSGAGTKAKVEAARDQAPVATSISPALPAATGVPSGNAAGSVSGKDARAALNGKRYRGADGQFEMTVLATETGLVVEAFRMISNRFYGSELRCGAFRSRIDLDEQLNVSAWCNGNVPSALRLAGRFPRIDIFTSGALGGGTIDLKEVAEARGR